MIIAGYFGESARAVAYELSRAYLTGTKDNTHDDEVYVIGVELFDVDRVRSELKFPKSTPPHRPADFTCAPRSSRSPSTMTG